MNHPRIASKLTLITVLATVFFVAYLLWSGALSSWPEPEPASQIVTDEAARLNAPATDTVDSQVVAETASSSRQQVVDEAASVATGEAQVLLLPARLPMVRRDLRCTSSSRESRLATTDGDGVVTLPVGVWRFDVPDVVLLEREALIQEGVRTVLWGSATASVSVTVVTSSGEPIVGASVRWACDNPTGSSRRWDGHAVTDPMGKVVLKAVPSCALRLRVAAFGFESQVFTEWSPQSQLRVILKASSSVMRLALVDSVTAQPVEVASFHCSLGGLDARSVGNGVFEVQLSHLSMPTEEIEVRSERYAAARVVFEPSVDTQRVALDPAANLNVSLARSDIGARMIVTAPWPVTNHPSAPPQSIQHGRLSDGGRCAFWLPIGSAARIEVYTDDGEYGEVVTNCITCDGDVAIETEASDSLEVTCYYQGRPISKQIRATIEVAGATLDVPGRRGGSVVVPFVNVTDSITIQGPGMEDVRLYPVDEVRSGRLRLDLNTPVEYCLVLVDENGKLVAGAEVRMVNMDPPPLDKFPGLNGRVPTPHPAWVRKIAPTRFAFTDGGGNLRLVVSAGRWMVRARCAGTAPPYADLYYAVEKNVVLSDGQFRDTITLPRNRVVQIHAFDAISGEPVVGLSVYGDQLVGSGRRLSTSRPLISVPTSCAWLEVAADGYTKMRVEIGDSDTVAISLSAGVSSGRIRFVGDSASELVGSDVLVFATRGGNSDGSIVWSKSVRVDAGGIVELSAGVRDGTAMHIANGGRFRFEPVHSVWIAGGEMRFRVIRQ